MENTENTYNVSVLERKALDLLETYQGANNYIIRLRQKQIDNKKFYPTRAQAEYIINYHETAPKVAKKWVELDSYFAQKLPMIIMPSNRTKKLSHLNGFLP